MSFHLVAELHKKRKQPLSSRQRLSLAPQVRLELTTPRLTAECSAIELLRNMESGDDLSSRAVSSQVLSTLKGLTSVFGMGTGGTPSPLSPEIGWRLLFLLRALFALCTFCLLGFLCGALRFAHPQNLIPLRFRVHRVSPGASQLSLLRAAFAFLRSSPRPISIDKLSHHCVYTVNLSTLSSARGLTSLCCGILFLEGGFTLRCLQRLSRPYFASLLCRWHDNSCTRGTSIPVLSY